MSGAKRPKSSHKSAKQNSEGSGSTDTTLVVQITPFTDASARKVLPLSLPAPAAIKPTAEKPQLQSLAILKPAAETPPLQKKPTPTDLERAKFGIPLESNKCFCFSYYDDYCDWPECCGVRTISICGCCHCEGVMCKSIEDPTMWRVLQSDSCDIVYPNILCHRYCQCLCFQCFLALPDLDLAFTETNVALVTITSVRDPVPPSGDAIVCLGLVCCVIALRGASSFQSFCGQKNYVRQSVLCCQQEVQLCQPLCGKPREDPNVLCKAGKCSLFMADPLDIVKLIYQLWCLDIRVGLPCDDEAPCIYTVCPFCPCGNGNCEPHCCAPIRTFAAMKDSGPPPVVIPEGVQITRQFN